MFLGHVTGSHSLLVWAVLVGCRCFWVLWEAVQKSTHQFIRLLLQLRDSLHQVVVALLQLVNLLLCTGLH